MLLCEIANAQTWFQLNSGTDSTLYDVCFINQDTGFVCGDGILLKTTNGGSNWTIINTGFNVHFRCIRFLDANIGFIGDGEGTLIKTMDGGSTWANIAPDMPGHFFGGNWFIDASTGVVAIGNAIYSAGQIFKTTDGGATWNPTYSSDDWINYFYFSDNVHGYATGNNGKVFRTSDGGTTWDSLNVDTNIWMSGVYFLDPDVGYVGGGSCVSYPYISTGSTWKTTDGGATWQEQTNGSSGAKLFFTSLNTGYNLWANCTGAGTLLKTTDGGNTWNNEPTPVNGLRGIFFISSSNGFAVGDYGVIIKYGIQTSTSDLVSDRTISVFPNPAANNINIISSLESQIIISDIQGQAVLNKSIKQGKTDIDLSSLAKGVYILRLYNKDKSEVIKIIKE